MPAATDTAAAPADLSGFISFGQSTGSARSNDEEGGSRTFDVGHAEQPEQVRTHPGLPVHGVIDISGHGEIYFGTARVDSALLALRPSLKPGSTPVVQLTVTSSCLPGLNRDVS